MVRVFQEGETLGQRVQEEGEGALRASGIMAGGFSTRSTESWSRSTMTYRHSL
jgi:hypothetical protein